MRTRDPLEVAIAEKLAREYPYGFEHMKAGPSAADYHAARIALRTLEELDGYEYAMGMGAESKPVGDVMDRYDRKPVWTDKKSAQGLVDFYIKEFPNEEFKLLKRRKAGKVEIV